jgi:hypothetical protein
VVLAGREEALVEREQAAQLLPQVKDSRVGLIEAALVVAAQLSKVAQQASRMALAVME